jgi:hypothetical protein
MANNIFTPVVNAAMAAFNGLKKPITVTNKLSTYNVETKTYGSKSTSEVIHGWISKFKDSVIANSGGLVLINDRRLSFLPVDITCILDSNSIIQFGGSKYRVIEISSTIDENKIIVHVRK